MKKSKTNNNLSSHHLFSTLCILIFCLLTLLITCNNPATENKSQPSKPFTLTFEQLEAQNNQNPKKSLIYIYDPACEDCTRVRMYALENPENEQYMQQYFYTTDISIYEERDIQFNNKNWVYKQDIVGRPYHELAQVLNQEENISTPCLSFLDEDLNLIVPIKKTVTAEELEILLVFVATDSFQKMTIEKFQDKYQLGSYLPPEISTPNPRQRGKR